jgi:hypothetical protein
MAMGGKASRACAVPGCGRALYPGNRSGVCRQHNHVAGFCDCHQCRSGKSGPGTGGDTSTDRQKDEIVLLAVKLRSRGYGVNDIAALPGSEYSARQFKQWTDAVKRADIAMEPSARAAYWKENA